MPFRSRRSWRIRQRTRPRRASPAGSTSTQRCLRRSERACRDERAAMSVHTTSTGSRRCSSMAWLACKHIALGGSSSDTAKTVTRRGHHLFFGILPSTDVVLVCRTRAENLCLQPSRHAKAPIECCCTSKPYRYGGGPRAGLGPAWFGAVLAEDITPTRQSYIDSQKATPCGRTGPHHSTRPADLSAPSEA